MMKVFFAALFLLASPAIKVRIGSQTYFLTTWTAQVPAAPETNTKDRLAYWKFHADLKNQEGGKVGVDVNRIYGKPDCIPTDPHEIAIIVIQNENAGYSVGRCPQK